MILGRVDCLIEYRAFPAGGVRFPGDQGRVRSTPGGAARLLRRQEQPWGRGCRLGLVGPARRVGVVDGGRHRGCQWVLFVHGVRGDDHCVGIGLFLDDAVDNVLVAGLWACHSGHVAVDALKEKFARADEGSDLHLH
jgi:hypothetical protein